MTSNPRIRDEDIASRKPAHAWGEDRTSRSMMPAEATLQKSCCCRCRYGKRTGMCSRHCQLLGCESLTPRLQESIRGRGKASNLNVNRRKGTSYSFWHKCSETVSCCWGNVKSTRVSLGGSAHPVKHLLGPYYVPGNKERKKSTKDYPAFCKLTM